MDIITLTASSLVALIGEVDTYSVSSVIERVEALPSKEITLYLDTPGGSVLAGLDLIYYMKASGRTFTCVAQNAASMGFAILQACDKRLVLPNSVIMQHQTSFGLMRGSSKQQQSFFPMLVRMSAELDFMQATRLALSPEEFEKKIEHDWWLFGEDVVTANVADALTLIKCDDSLKKVQHSGIVSAGMFGMVEVRWPGCPLIQKPVPVKEEKDEKKTQALLTQVSAWKARVHERKEIIRINDWSTAAP